MWNAGNHGSRIYQNKVQSTNMNTATMIFAPASIEDIGHKNKRRELAISEAK